jgi:uncharacterized protein
MDSPTTNKQALRISLDFRLLSAILALVIIAMLAFWQPWNDPRAQDRTIEVTGQAQVTAVPDEFVFYPSYEFKNDNKQAALDELSKKSNEIVAKLKGIGVPDNKIKTNSSGYDYPVYSKPEEGRSTPTYSLTLTVTVDTKELAQKVQDYLVTTTPSGAVSPQPQFSDKKRTELEAQARDQATKDARAKAEQSAKNLGFSLGAVKSVADGAGFGGVPYAGRGLETDAVSPKLTVQPGENELTYMVTVAYFVK